MLVRFIVSNFLSFRDNTEFLLVKGNSRSHSNHIYNKGTDLELLKASAIYGANASGKSNFIKAVDIFKAAVLGVHDAFFNIENRKFKLDKNTLEQPITFEVELFLNKALYYYILKLNNNGIELEELYKRSSVKATDRLIFRRTTKNDKHKLELPALKTNHKEKELIIKVYETKALSPFYSFLSVFNGSGIEDIDLVYSWILQKLIVEEFQTSALDFVRLFAKDKDFRDFANIMIKNIDAGIEKLDVKKYTLDEFFGADYKAKKRILFNLKTSKAVYIEFDRIALLDEGRPYVFKIFSVRKDYSGDEVEFELQEESDGTVRFLSLVPMLYAIVKKPVTVFVDEIGRSLHPSLLKEILRFIMNYSTRGQLVFTTHETHLLDLDIFRRDEIWFTEKKTDGNTVMYSLAEFKPRTDKNIRNDYLMGRYGAIPFLQGFEHQNLISDAKE